MSRDLRQKEVGDWCLEAFGAEHCCSVEQRAIRFLEEAIELFQAAGGDGAMAHRLVDYIFSRPAGDLYQELGGVGVTILAFANAAGLSADQAEVDEINRCLSKPIEHFRRRNEKKNELGFRA